MPLFAYRLSACTHTNCRYTLTAAADNLYAGKKKENIHRRRNVAKIPGSVNSANKQR